MGAAWKLADKELLAIGDDGAVSGADEAVAALEESTPFLVAADDGPEEKERNPFKSAKSSGRTMNGKRKPLQQGLDRKTLEKKYPALRQARQTALESFAGVVEIRHRTQKRLRGVRVEKAGVAERVAQLNQLVRSSCRPRQVAKLGSLSVDPLNSGEAIRRGRLVESLLYPIVQVIDSGADRRVSAALDLRRAGAVIVRAAGSHQQQSRDPQHRLPAHGARGYPHRRTAIG